MGKDVAWKYGKKVDGIARGLTYVKCNFCGVTSKGGITRLKNHLAGTHFNVVACLKVTAEVKQEMLWALEGVQKSKQVRERNQTERVMSGSYYASGSTSVGGGGSESQRGVRGPIDRFVTDKDGNNDNLSSNTSFGIDARKAVCKDIGRFFYECALAFNIASSPSFINMCISLGNYGRGFKPSSPYELSTWILVEEEKQTNTCVEEVKRTWPHTGVTIMSNGWKDIAGRQLINFLVNNPYGTVFLKSIDASAVVKDANLIYNLIDEVVEEVGPELVVQVVTDNASNYKAVGKMLMDKRPNLFWTPCAAHCIDLMLEKIGELPQHRNALSRAKKVCNFIYNHGWVLALMRTHTKKELIKPAATRFATAYLTLQSMQDAKESLDTMFSRREWQVSSWSKNTTAKEVKNIIRSNNFWKGLDNAIKTTKPLVNVLRMADSEKIHTKRRNRLTTQKLNTLAYIMYNKKLKEKHLKNIQLKEDEDPLVHDCCPSDDEWVVPEPENLANVPMLLLQNEQNIDETYGNSSEQSLKRKKQQSSVATGKGKKRIELVDEEIHDVDSSSSDSDDGDDEGEYRPHTYFNSDFYSSFVPLDTDDTLLN